MGATIAELFASVASPSTALGNEQRRAGSGGFVLAAISIGTRN